MPNLPRHLQLTGGDYFILALDRQMRRAGLPGNVCRLVWRLEGTVDTDRLRQRLATSPLLHWLARVHMMRFLPILSPRWRVTAGPSLVLHEHDDHGGSGDDPTLPP